MWEKVWADFIKCAIELQIFFPNMVFTKAFKMS